jgi:putative tricarboxylic transport membrane protein
MVFKVKKWMVATLAFSMLGACAKKDMSNAEYKPEALIMVAPSGAGGGWDKTARSISKVLTDTKIINGAMTVENVPGASGAKFLASYTTKDVGNNNTVFVNSPPILINNLRKDGNSPVGYKDVTPIAGLTKDFAAIVVKADSPYKDLKSLVDAIKADPSKVSIGGGSSPGSLDHLSAMLPFFKAGVDVTKVKYLPHDGGGEALTALLGGNLAAISTDASSVVENVKAGKVRVLGISAPERITWLDAPTYKEAGISGAEFVVWRGVFGPKDMSKSALAFWSKAFADLSAKPEWAAELKAQGWEADYKDAAAFTAYLGQQEVLLKELLTALQMAK